MKGKMSTMKMMECPADCPSDQKHGKSSPNPNHGGMKKIMKKSSSHKKMAGY